MEEEDLVSERGKDYPDEFMICEHDNLFTGESFFSFLKELFLDQIIVSCHHECHEPYDSSNKIFIFSLGYPAMPYVVTGSMDGRIKPDVSYEFFVAFETPYISNFSEETNGCQVFDDLNGFNNLQTSVSTLKAQIGQDVVELLKLFPEQKELRDFPRENEFFARAHVGYRVLGQRYDLFRRDIGLSSLVWFDELSFLGGRRVFNHPGRRIFFEEIEDSFGVDFCGLKNFRECQGAMKHTQEACDGHGVLFIGLGLPKENLHEIRDEEGIDDCHMVTFVCKKEREGG